MPAGLGFLGSTAVLAVGGMIAVGAAVYQDGAIRISVDEKKPDGHHIHLIAPAAIVPVGMRFVPDNALKEASSQLQVWAPAIKIAAVELEKYRDFVLVEVEDESDHVKITKRGGSLVIDVNDAEDTVHVSFPIHSAISAIRRIEAATPGT